MIRPGPSEATIDVLDVMGSARAARHLLPDAVPDDILERLVWAATRAASPNNTQLWHFVVVTSPATKQAITDTLDRFKRWVDRMGAPADERDAQIRRDSRHLLDRLGDAPAIIVVCGSNTYPEGAPDDRYLWSTIGAASQNLVVAARALGLGATVTMFHVANERGVADVLGLPEDIVVGALIPVGYPAKPGGPVRRRPLSEVLHHDRW